MIGVFAYASLVNSESASETLARAVEPDLIADLVGYRRNWSVARDNRACEKTFARSGDRWVPETILLLNAQEAQSTDRLNGVVYSVKEAELKLLTEREKRYMPVEVGGSLTERDSLEGENVGLGSRYERIYTFIGKTEHVVGAPPVGSCVLNSYLAAVAAGFESLGEREVDTYRATTDDHGVEVIESELLSGGATQGRPGDW